MVMSKQEQEKHAGQEAENSGEKRNPAGLTPRSGGLTSEYAREQGWDLNEAERMKSPQDKQEYDGGRDYEYGPRDFGDTAVDTSSAEPERFGMDKSGIKSRAQQNAGEDSVERNGEEFSGPETSDI
jgi:hypothetical protein